jgi:hypothetical protein
VLWRGKNGWTRKPFDQDFSEALRIYVLLKSNGKTGVTLRSCNVSFPPPERITQSPVTKWTVVRRNGKRYKKKVIEYEDLLQTKYNPEGIFWCPYCIKLRHFPLVQGIDGSQHYECPVCGITSRDWYVKKHNPQATVIEFRKRRRGRRTRTRVRRRAK